jgi:hypothetical protein
MDSKLKAAAITAAIAYLVVLAYHKNMLPLAKGLKKVEDPSAKAGD